MSGRERGSVEEVVRQHERLKLDDYAALSELPKSQRRLKNPDGVIGSY